jgi:hypothetical protein
MSSMRPLLVLAASVLLVATSATAPAVANSTRPDAPAASVASVADTTASAVVPTATGGAAAMHDVTVVLLEPEGVPRNYTRDDVLTSMRQVDAFYARETGGRVRFRVTSATDWIPVTDPGFRCDDFESVLGLAERQSGWTPGPDEHLVAMVPDQPACGPVAQGEQQESVDAGGRVFMTSVVPALIAHELGHTLSLHHASSLQCSSSWDADMSRGVPAGCTRVEYGDDADFMGSSYSFLPLSAASLARLGVLSHRVVPACGATRRISIHTMGAGVDAQRIIAWRDPRHPAVVYYAQFRAAADASAYRSVWQSPYAVDRPSGVQVLRSDPDSSAAGSVLVRPGDDGVGRERIRAGERVALVDGMSVQVVGIDEQAAVATVDVTVPCAASGAAPETTGAPEAVHPPLVVNDFAR